jgi:predicted alpha/beta hydrolase family esterase
VIGISHTGHLYDNKIKNWQPINLLTQINHKIEYIEKNLLNDDVNVVLIGHSIGCYIILEVLNYLNQDLKKKIKKAFLLMPTIGIFIL